MQYKQNISSKSASKAKLENLVNLHGEVFQGYDKKNKEEFLVKFSIKPDATPFAQ